MGWFVLMKTLTNAYVDVMVYTAAASPSSLKAYLSSRFAEASKVVSVSVENTRNGGCGTGRIVCSRTLADGHAFAIGDIVDVYLYTEEDFEAVNDHVKLYRGMILDFNENYDNDTFTITTVGLFFQFSRCPVVTYIEGASMTSVIASLFASYIYPYSWCSVTMDVSMSSPVTLGDVEFEFASGDDAVIKLATVQGNIIYGVNTSSQFYFKDRSTTQIGYFQVGLNAKNVRRHVKGRDLYNAVFVRCNKILSSGTLVRYFSDSTSIASYKRRAKVVTAPELTDPDDLDDWGDAQIAALKDPITTYDFELYGTTEAVWPDGKVVLVDTDGTELVDQYLLAVRYLFTTGEGLVIEYRVGEADATYELGDEALELQRKIAMIETNEISKDRISHTGYEEFKQYVLANALAAGKYNYMVTEFEEDAV